MERLAVLITGSSSGFGKLIAQTLAQDGHLIFASMRNIGGRNLEPARELVEWSNREGGSIKVVELDVTNQDSVDVAVRSILDSAGQIDVVVNNAGTGAVGVLEAFTVEQTQQLFDVNTFGPLRVNRAVLPHMRERRSGLLIHISSVAGRLCAPMCAAYSASKFALESIAEYLSDELAYFGIDSVVVEPGAYPTPAEYKRLLPADSDVVEAYSEVTTMRQQIFATMEEFTSNARAPDPQEVAAGVKRLIDMPAGQRPLRTVLGNTAVGGLEHLNRASEEGKRQLLESRGLPID